MSASFYTYIIWNSKHLRYYVGQTEDIAKRLKQHNDPDNDMSKFTKKYDGGWTLLHSETFPARSEAVRRENLFRTIPLDHYFVRV